MSRKIVTTYINPPIPTRGTDWCAHYDGEEEAGNYGYGATEAAAILDFINLRDEGDARVFLLSAGEGVLFDPEGRYHGWLMRRHPDGFWVSVQKLESADPEDNPMIQSLMAEDK